MATTLKATEYQLKKGVSNTSFETLKKSPPPDEIVRREFKRPHYTEG